MLARLVRLTAGCSVVAAGAFCGLKTAPGSGKVGLWEDLSEAAQEARLKAEGAKQCAFCKAMVSSPCGVEFVAWEKCIEQNPDAFVMACASATKALSECMNANPEYFEKQRAEEERQIKA